VAGLITNRWRWFKGLVAFAWFLGTFYGDSLRAYPFAVGLKMLAARLAFLVPFPFLLPDKRFLLDHHGAKMYRQLSPSPIHWDIALGTYEFWKTRLFSTLVQEGMTFLDIGACEGYYSILCARLMNDKGRVLAFEPDPRNSRWLRSNVEANGYKCIEVLEYALSDSEGRTTFYPGGGVGSLVHTPSPLANFQTPSDPFAVRTRPLDSVLSEANIKNIDLMKIDVEGADLLVLKGARHTLETTNVRILMDVDVHGAERAELFDLLHSCGFSLFRVGRSLEPIKLSPRSEGPPNTQDHDASKQGPSTLLSIKTRLRSALPARVVSFLSITRIVLRRYLTIPIQWFAAPRQIREIYAVKSADSGQSR